jgi:hypothetical protein
MVFITLNQPCSDMSTNMTDSITTFFFGDKVTLINVYGLMVVDEVIRRLVVVFKCLVLTISRHFGSSGNTEELTMQ